MYRFGDSLKHDNDRKKKKKPLELQPLVLSVWCIFGMETTVYLLTKPKHIVKETVQGPLVKTWPMSHLLRTTGVRC